MPSSAEGNPSKSFPNSAPSPCCSSLPCRQNPTEWRKRSSSNRRQRSQLPTTNCLLMWPAWTVWGTQSCECLDGGETAYLYLSALLFTLWCSHIIGESVSFLLHLVCRVVSVSLETHQARISIGKNGLYMPEHLLWLSCSGVGMLSSVFLPEPWYSLPSSHPSLNYKSCSCIAVVKICILHQWYHSAQYSYCSLWEPESCHIPAYLTSWCKLDKDALGTYKYCSKVIQRGD